MSDWTDALARMKFRVREKTNTFVDDADFLIWYNRGGRRFCAKTWVLKDMVVVPVPVAGGGAMDGQIITDANNTFTKVELRNTDPKVEFYKIAKALYIDWVILLDTSSPANIRFIEPINKQKELDERVYDTASTTNLPEVFRTFMPDHIALWKQFTDSFKLLIEYRRKWVDVVDTTQETIFLDDRWSDGPEEYALWKIGVSLNLFNFAAESKATFKELEQEGIEERNKETMYPAKSRMTQ